MPSVLQKAFWLFGLAVILLIIFLPGYTKVQELRERNNNLEARIEQLKIEHAILQKELQRIKNDPVYQEKIAREKMGVVRKGEVPVKIISE